MKITLHINYDIITSFSLHIWIRYLLYIFYNMSFKKNCKYNWVKEILK